MAITGKVNPRTNAFGPFPQAPNHQVINNWENYFVTEDATGTPQTSPLSVVIYSNTITTLVVPAAAVVLRLYASAALRISEQASLARYFLVPASILVEWPCMTPQAGLVTTGNLYIGGDAATVTLQFAFLCI